MRQRFTKMQGAGNDFVVLDATRAPLALGAAQLRRLGDRRFGVGADQILVVEPPDGPDVDFRYRIFNGASGAEVEHCGNGARCVVRYVHEHGLSDRPTLRVRTLNRVLVLASQADGAVRVDMGVPDFDPAALPFDPAGLVARPEGDGRWWSLPLDGRAQPVEIVVLSMGNPHAVQRVPDVDAAAVLKDGPRIEHHPRFAHRVNAGFVQVLTREHVRLRVWERDAGETLACGTGACAAVAAGIRLGWLDGRVAVDTRGGQLTVEWDGGDAVPLWMTGPAQTVFEGEIEL
ncbi:MAG: diaminopimelate epimerase [Rubrivivax sp.]